MTTPEGGPEAPYPPPPPGPDAYPPATTASPADMPAGYPAQPQYPPAGPEAYYAPPPTPPNRSRRTGLVAIGVLVVIIVVAVGGLAFFRNQIAGGVNDLQIGDCIDEPSEASSITDVQHRPCSDQHDGEVFYVLRDPAADDAVYPGTEYFRQAAVTACLPAASVYTGTQLASSSDYDIAWFYPTSDSWSSGDRGMSCYLYRVDGTKMTGSLKAGITQ